LFGADGVAEEFCLTPSAQSLVQAELRNSQYAVTSFAEHCAQAGLAVFFDIGVAEAEYFATLNTSADYRRTSEVAHNEKHLGLQESSSLDL
jgi:hypothetical protein